MGTGPTVGHYNFAAWDLPTKYGWMHSGPGVQEATRVQDLVNRMAERMIASGELVSRLLSGAEWAGAAAIAAGETMRRGAGQINQTAAEAATAQRCVTELGESFQSTQHRVPSPNEIPTGLGDRFLFGAAEGLSAVSPFDVQSPLHDALEQRRELDQQANLALTDHMNMSRERVEAIPVVTAPAPMVVSGDLAGAAGGGVPQPAGAAPVAGGFGGNPTATTATGWAGAPTVSSVAPGAGGSTPPSIPSGPPSSTVVGPTGGVPYRPSSGSVPQPTGTGTGLGSAGAPLVPSAGGRTGGEGRLGAGGRVGSGGAAARGGAGFGLRSGPDAGGVSGRGGPGREGLVGGPAAPGPRGGNRAGAGSFLQSPLSGHGSGDDQDAEHRDRYAQQADHIVGELPLVAPAVIGETPDEERRRLDRDGQ